MNWPAYNQSFVRRGEILLGFDVINNWTHLKEMNKYKVGLGAISLSKHSLFTFLFIANSNMKIDIMYISLAIKFIIDKIIFHTLIIVCIYLSSLTFSFLWLM
jgi:hypothetical protein